MGTTTRQATAQRHLEPPFDKQALTAIGEGAAAALESFAAAHGLTVTFDRSGKIGETYVIAGIRFDAIGTDAEADLFMRNARLVGLEPTDLHRRFVLREETYEVVGMKPGVTKNPILCVRGSDGVRVRFPEGHVRTLLETYPAK